MVTVGDLIARLKMYDEKMPVYWGINGCPCWCAKQAKTINDFPMRAEESFRSKYCCPEIEEHTYLYFADYTDYEEAIVELNNVPNWIRWLFNR